LAADGFALPEAKSDATYLDDDTVLFSTAADGATKSGYANIVKQWQRGTPIAAAKKIYEGDKADVGSSAVSFHTREGNFAVITRSVSFFETDYFAVENGAAKKLSMPRSADLKGMIHGALIASLRETIPEIVFLGIQPQDVVFLGKMTPEVRLGVETLHRNLVQGLGIDDYAPIGEDIAPPFEGEGFE